MSHVPEEIEYYVCANCQVVHAGTPVHRSDGGHSFEPPESCGGCADEEFVRASEWIRHHE